MHEIKQQPEQELIDENIPENHEELIIDVSLPSQENESIAGIEQVEIVEPPTKKQKTIISKVDNISLQEVLEQHHLGPSILQIYSVKNELDSIAQSYLCEIIISFLLDNN